MIEEQLAQYGVLGIWTVTLLVEKFIDKFFFVRRMKEMLKENREYMMDLMSVKKCAPAE